MMLILLAVVCLNVYLYVIIPEGLFSDPGHRPADRLHPGRPEHLVPGDAAEARRASSTSSAPIRRSRTSSRSPAARSAIPGRMFVQLKPLAERKESADKIIARLRIKLANEPGANLFLNPVQDIRVGGRQANATYQYTLQADDLDELRTWEPRIRAALSQPAATGRRQHRPAGQGAADLAGDRSRRGGAAGRLAEADRHDPERRVRAAAGVDDLFGAQPVSRRDGGGARVLAVARRARRRLRQHDQGRPGSAVGVRALRADQHRARRQSPVAVRRLDDLVQSARGNVARPGDGRDRRRARANSAFRRRYAAASREPRRRSRIRSTASRG